MGKVGAVFLFEWRRALTLPRIAWWLALTLFPVFIVTLIRITTAQINPNEELPRELWAFFLWALVPMLVTMLGTFLWTAPAVSAELERKSWVYLAVRPHGCNAVLIGKYLAAVTWVLPAALIGLTLAVLIAQTGDGWRLWTSIAGLSCLACLAYAAVYLLLGVIFPNRAMVIAVAYTLIFELIIAWVPAMINQISVQFRLRALLVDWAEIEIGSSPQFDSVEWIGDAPASHHVLILLGYTLTLLLVALALIRWREFSTADESDV